jgi:hypothetical protein
MITLNERVDKLLANSTEKILQDSNLRNELARLVLLVANKDICTACPGILQENVYYLQRLRKENKLKINKTHMSNTKRYSLPKGSTYRPFGSPEVYTNENITDEIVESLIKAEPNVAKVFIDSQAPVVTTPPTDPTGDPDGEKAIDLEKLTKKELAQKYAELTGKSIDPDKTNKSQLIIDVQKEIDALKKI